MYLTDANQVFRCFHNPRCVRPEDYVEPATHAITVSPEERGVLPAWRIFGLNYVGRATAGLTAVGRAPKPLQCNLSRRCPALGHGRRRVVAPCARHKVADCVGQEAFPLTPVRTSTPGTRTYPSRSSMPACRTRSSRTRSAPTACSFSPRSAVGTMSFATDHRLPLGPPHQGNPPGVV